MMFLQLLVYYIIHLVLQKLRTMIAHILDVVCSTMVKILSMCPVERNGMFQH
jgi:hypothetical protein